MKARKMAYTDVGDPLPLDETAQPVVGPVWRIGSLCLPRNALPPSPAVRSPARLLGDVRPW